ncbi:MAG: MATE family efflux transporter [Porphyromonas sp.]|nr:MATE family efflux transporter [Porphyromonas sp.]
MPQIDDRRQTIATDDKRNRTALPQNKPLEPLGSTKDNDKPSLQKAPYRELLTIGTPIILGQVGVILVSFVDNMMVGRYHTDHFAAASFVNNLFALVYVLGIGFAYGLTPLVTTAWTQRRAHKAGALLRHSLALNLGLALISSVVMGALYFRLDLFNLPPELAPIARPYYLLQLLSFLLFMAFNALKQYFDGIGKTSVGMWTIVLANGVNVLFNWLLIYGVAGFPEWGLWGAGIATLFSRVLTLLLVIIYFFYGQAFRMSVRGFCSMYWSPRNLRRLLKIGIPVGTYSGVETASFTVALIFVTQLGKIPLATHQILCVVTTIGFFIYYGLGAATTILVSKYRTLGQLDEARRITSAALRLCIAAACLAMSIMFLSKDIIGYLFTDEKAIVEMTAIALIPVILYQLGDAIQVLYANALRGMEDVTHLAIYASLTHLVLEPSLAYTFGFCLGIEDHGLQLTAIWSAFPIGLLLLGLLLRRRFLRVTSLTKA